MMKSYFLVRKRNMCLYNHVCNSLTNIKLQYQFQFIYYRTSHSLLWLWGSQNNLFKISNVSQRGLWWPSQLAHGISFGQISICSTSNHFNLKSLERLDLWVSFEMKQKAFDQILMQDVWFLTCFRTHSHVRHMIDRCR